MDERHASVMKKLLRSTERCYASIRKLMYY